jgi:hypothetical protein
MERGRRARKTSAQSSSPCGPQGLLPPCWACSTWRSWQQRIRRWWLAVAIARPRHRGVCTTQTVVGLVEWLRWASLKGFDVHGRRRYLLTILNHPGGRNVPLVDFLSTPSRKRLLPRRCQQQRLGARRRACVHAAVHAAAQWHACSTRRAHARACRRHHGSQARRASRCKHLMRSRRRGSVWWTANRLIARPSDMGQRGNDRSTGANLLTS